MIIKIQDMEELRKAIYNEIDIVTERNYHVIDQLTKLEIQSKFLGLGIVASESYSAVLQMSKQQLINFILQLNLYYVDETEENNESAPSNMDDTQYRRNDTQESRNDTHYLYGYYGRNASYDGNSDWQYNNQAHYHWSQQQQFQSNMYEWNQWNGWNQKFYPTYHKK